MAYAHPNCKLVKNLEYLVKEGNDTSGSSTGMAAVCALRIIEDMHTDYIAPVDIVNLVRLLPEIQKDIQIELLTSMDDGDYDCTICEKLARHLGQPGKL
jgi:hypothetical protein